MGSVNTPADVIDWDCDSIDDIYTQRTKAHNLLENWFTQSTRET